RAAVTARRAFRHGAGISQGARRVRCDDYLRLEHPWRNADARARDLRLRADARWRRTRLAAALAVDCDLVRCAPDLRSARPPARTEAVMLRLDISHRIVRITLDVRLD